LEAKRLAEQLGSARRSITELFYELETARNERDVACKERDLASHAKRVALDELQDQKARVFELASQADQIRRDRDALEDVVNQYATLVRSLDSKRPQPQAPATPPESDRSDDASSSSRSLSDPQVQPPSVARSTIVLLQQGRIGLSRLLSESNSTIARLESSISSLSARLQETEDSLAAERTSSSDLRARFSEIQSELLAARANDSAADRLLEDYAAFFQSCQDHLHDVLTDTKNRHAATVSTLSTRVTTLSTALEAEQNRGERLRAAVDELARDLTREAFGRRTEVKLRLEQVKREQELVEWLEDSRQKATVSGSSQDLGTGAVSHGLLSAFDAPPAGEVNPEDPRSVKPLHPLLQNAALLQDLVASLLEDLDAETSKRVRLERRLALEDFHSPTKAPLHPDSQQNHDEDSNFSTTEQQSVKIEDSTYAPHPLPQEMEQKDESTESAAIPIRAVSPNADIESSQQTPTSDRLGTVSVTATRPSLSVNPNVSNPAINTLSALARALPQIPSTPSSPSLGPDFVGTSLASQVRLLFGPLRDELSAIQLSLDQLQSDLSLNSALSSAASSSSAAAPRVAALMAGTSEAEERLRELKVDIEIAFVDGQRAANVFEAQARLSGRPSSSKVASVVAATPEEEERRTSADADTGDDDDSAEPNPLASIAPTFEALSARVQRLSEDVAGLGDSVTQLNVSPSLEVQDDRVGRNAEEEEEDGEGYDSNDDDKDEAGQQKSQGSRFNPLETIFQWSRWGSPENESRPRRPEPKPSLSFGEATWASGGSPKRGGRVDFPTMMGGGGGSPSSLSPPLSGTSRGGGPMMRTTRSVSMNDNVLRTSRSTPTLGIGLRRSPGTLVGLGTYSNGGREGEMRAAADLDHSDERGGESEGGENSSGSDSDSDDVE
jgi:hypothetical protein